MDLLSWDLETYLFDQGCMAPKIVCMSIAHDPESTPRIYLRDDALEILDGIINDQQTHIGANLAYDLACVVAARPEWIDRVFDLHDRGLIWDIQTAEKLIDNARGLRQGREYSLAHIVERRYGVKLDKDTWRLRYAELDGIDPKDWPEDARKYSESDAYWPLRIYQDQQSQKEYLKDLPARVRTRWWLHLTQCWGLQTDAHQVRALKEATVAKLKADFELLNTHGLLRWRKDQKGVWGWGRVDKAARERVWSVAKERGVLPVVTEPAKSRKSVKPFVPQPQLTADAVGILNDDVLDAFARWGTAGSQMTTVLTLAKGVKKPIHPSYDELVATGRTSSREPLNIQNQRRAPGFRECFIPRPGYAFVAGDYEALELHTLAQVCWTLLGQSKLRDYLNTHKDPHIGMAATLEGLSYETMLEHSEKKSKRQFAKVPNFGFPGGLGASTFISYAKQNGFTLTLEEAQHIRTKWFEQWPEMEAYFDLVASKKHPTKGILIEQLFTGRFRGGCTFPAAANTYFQGLAADGATYAGWLVSKACYIDRDSPLYGCRIVAFVHDELLLEVPIERVHECALELQRLMVEGMNRFVPDVPSKVEPIAMLRWSKAAKPAFVDGRLIPWEQKEAA